MMIDYSMVELLKLSRIPGLDQLLSSLHDETVSGFASALPRYSEPSPVSVGRQRLPQGDGDGFRTELESPVDTAS
jgi:hypothetical protein